FDAADYFVKQKQELNRHQFGGTLGGPLVQGKTFFFVSYEGIRETRQLPVNVIPASRLSPQAQYFNRYIPDPNTSSGTYAWSADRKLSADQFTIRIDHNLSEKHRVFARYSFH